MASAAYAQPQPYYGQQGYYGQQQGYYAPHGLPAATAAGLSAVVSAVHGLLSERRAAVAVPLLEME